MSQGRTVSLGYPSFAWSVLLRLSDSPFSGSLPYKRSQLQPAHPARIISSGLGRTSYACGAMPASRAAVPSPLVARPNRTMLVMVDAMEKRNVKAAILALVLRVMRAPRSWFKLQYTCQRFRRFDCRLTLAFTCRRQAKRRGGRVQGVVRFRFYVTQLLLLFPWHVSLQDSGELLPPRLTGIVYL